jgi:hypothetical protein
MQLDDWLAVKFDVTTVLSSLLLLSLMIEAAMEVRVGYNELYVVTRLNELTSILFIAPHCHMVGYIVLCIALRQNWWFAHSYSM